MRWSASNNERHLGDTALEYYGRKFSYADLIVQIKRPPPPLQALGVKKGRYHHGGQRDDPGGGLRLLRRRPAGRYPESGGPRYSAEGIREYIEEVESRLLICLNVVYPPLPSGRKAHQRGAGGGAQPRRQPAAGQSRGLQADRAG